MGRTFTLDFKLSAVNYAEKKDVKKAAQKFNVDPKSIREWRFLKSPPTQSQDENEIVYHSFNLDFKLNAIRYAKENGIEAAAKKYNVNPDGIRKWCNGRYLKGTLKHMPQNKNERTRKYNDESQEDADNKCIREEIENNLVLWIVEQQKNNVLVTKPMIKVKALELFKTEYSESRETFKATLTWVQEFLVRKKLNLNCCNVFTLDFKLKVIKYAKKNGILKAAKEYNLSPKYVRDWYNSRNLVDATKQTENSNPSDFNSGAHRRVQRTFTLNFKLDAIKYARENGLSAAAKEYNVDRKSISEWCSGRKIKKGLKLITKDKESNKSKNKCININEDIENLLALWITELQKKNILVTKQMIKAKALEMLKKEHQENFHFSPIWIQEFLKRKELNLIQNVSTNVQIGNVTVESSPSIIMVEEKNKSRSNVTVENSSSMMMVEQNNKSESNVTVQNSPSIIMVGQKNKSKSNLKVESSPPIISEQKNKSGSNVKVSSSPSIIISEQNNKSKSNVAVPSFPSIMMVDQKSKSKRKVTVESSPSIIISEQNNKSESIVTVQSSSSIITVKQNNESKSDATMESSPPIITVKQNNKSKSDATMESSTPIITVEQNNKSKSDATMESSPSIITVEQKSEKVSKQMLPTLGLKSVKKDLHKTVKASERKHSTGSLKFKKKKIVNCVSPYNSNFNSCISNVVNEDLVSIKIKEVFSLNSQSNPTVDCFTNIEQSKNASSTIKEGECNFVQTVHPMTIQGLMASIAFQTHFNVKHT